MLTIAPCSEYADICSCMDKGHYHCSGSMSIRCHVMNMVSTTRCMKWHLSFTFKMYYKDGVLPNRWQKTDVSRMQQAVFALYICEAYYIHKSQAPVSRKVGILPAPPPHTHTNTHTHTHRYTQTYTYTHTFNTAVSELAPITCGITAYEIE